MFGDGGGLENYGIIPLLRRGVRRIVLFINTATPLGTGLVESSQARIDMNAIDMYLPPLFGVGVEGLDQDYLCAHGLNVDNNQVFANASGEFAALVSELQRKKLAGLPVTAECKLQTHPNQFWGLAQPSYELDVCFVYLEDVAVWSEQLDPEVQALLQHDPGFENFPHYKTIHQNSGLDLLSLTPVQVNMVSHFCSWVCENGGVLKFAASNVTGT